MSQTQSHTGSEVKWEEISSIETGLDDHRLPSSRALAGKQVRLLAPGQPTISLTFLDESTLRWEQAGDVSEEAYDAVEGADALFIVGVCHAADRRRSTTLVLDFAEGRATRVSARLPSVAEADQSLVARVHAGEGLSPVRAEFEAWDLESSERAGPPKAPVHTRTDRLVGKRVLYTYGDGGVYEHIYLNERLFTWHCRKGPEAGLADTETCDFFQIRPEVYLFSWREKIIPTLGVVLVNTEQMRSNGFITGIDTRSGEVSHFPVGARGELLNVTETLP